MMVSKEIEVEPADTSWLCRSTLDCASERYELCHREQAHFCVEHNVGGVKPWLADIS